VNCFTQGVGFEACKGGAQESVIQTENGGFGAPAMYAKRTMTDSEKWKELCAQAAVEQDPQRLFELVQQINEILEQMEMAKKRQAERKSQ
jgi:hypothetical protein